jgi:L-threonylcarbamoyladenylate synthase
MTPPIAALIEHLRGGGILAYPTETVYGLGARVTAEGIAGVQQLKGRGTESPFLTLLPEDPRGIEGLVAESPWARALEWTPDALRLAEAYWPGPLTLILRARLDALDLWPLELRNPEGGVGVRVSPHPFVRDLLSQWGEPILSTSANRSGHPPVRDAEALRAQMEGQPGWERCQVVDAGVLPPSAPSTVLDCTGARPVGVREGAIPLSEIEGLLADSKGIPFRLLFVCTGNTCRSPLAEVLARRALEKKGWGRRVEVRSAGVAAFPGDPASDGSRIVAREVGLDLSNHRAAAVDDDLVDWADLILTMSPHHLTVLQRVGAGARTALITAFAEGRDTPLGSGEGVSDPIGGEVGRYRETREQLEELIDRVLVRLSSVLDP